MADKKSISGADFLKNELKSTLSGAYFLYGEEDYMKQYYLHEIEAVTVKDKSSLRFLRLTADEFSLGALEDALTSAPSLDMFSFTNEEEFDTKLIELYEIDFKALKPSEFTSVCTLIKENATDGNIIVIFSTEAELPCDSKSHQNIIRELSKIAKPCVFNTEPDSRLASWISKRAGKELVVIDPYMARMLIDRAGHNMLILKNETDKLIAYVKSHGKGKVEAEDIKTVTVANKEIAPFDFANALMRRDSKAAFFIISDMKSRSEEPIIILSTVSKVVNSLINVRGSMDLGLSRSEIARRFKMHEYTVKLYSEALANTDISTLFEIAHSVYEADLTLKSLPIDSFVVLERLICLLCDKKD